MVVVQWRRWWTALLLLLGSSSSSWAQEEEEEPLQRFVASSVPGFLLPEEMDHFLGLADATSDNGQQQRSSHMTNLSQELHRKLRHHLSGRKDEFGETEVAVTTLFRTTNLHQDHYRAEDALDRPVLNAKTGFVFLESNDQAHFIVDGEPIAAQAGKLVVFDGSAPHFTQLPAGQRLRLLGPFALWGRRLSLVGVRGTTTTAVQEEEEEAALETTTTTVAPTTTTTATEALQTTTTATLKAEATQILTEKMELPPATTAKAVPPTTTTATTSETTTTTTTATTAELATTLPAATTVYPDTATPEPAEPDLPFGACLVVSDPAGYTLTSDFSCNCSGRPAAIEVRGDAALILDGYQVSCLDDSPPESAMVDRGIVWLNGERSRVKSGIISGVNSTGRNCIYLDGNSSRVTDTTLEACYYSGIVTSDSSLDVTISGNIVKDCHDAPGIVFKGHLSHIERNTVLEAFMGLLLLGSYNEVQQNEFDSSALHGVQIHREHNNITNNIIRGAGGNGLFVLAGVTQCRFTHNIISLTLESGVFLMTGAIYNTLEWNEISYIGSGSASHFSAEHGIYLQGSTNLLANNRITDTADQAIMVMGNDNFLVANYILNSGNNGIQISYGAELNVLEENRIDRATPNCIVLDGRTHNSSLISNRFRNCGQNGIVVESLSFFNQLSGNHGYSSSGDFDLVDMNTNCLGNNWTDNIGTGSPDCTQTTS